MGLDLVINRVPLAIRDAIWQRKGKLILLHEVDHPDGYVRAWSGIGDLTYDGFGWIGLGDLVSIEGIGGSRETKVRVVTVRLGGISADQLQFVTSKVRGRQARLSLAALKQGRREVNGDIFTVCTGTCDTQEHEISEDRSATIILTVNQPVFILDRAPGLAWSPDWLKSTYGESIVGLDDLPGVAARTESWTP